MLRKWTLALACVLASAAMTGATKAQEEFVLSSYKVTTDQRTMDEIAQRFEVYRELDDGYEVYVPRHRASELLELDPDAELLLEDIAEEIRRLEKDDSDFAGYRTFSEVEAYLQGLAEAHPDIVSLETYGVTRQGRPLYVLKLSDNVTVDEDEPEILLTAATHGDELITVEVLLGLLDELVNGYGKDPRLTAMVDGKEIFLIPVVNADGFANRSRYAGGVDPNREYPYPQRPSRNPVDCIQAEMDWFASRNIVGSMDLHASGQLVMYPWGYTRNAPEGEDALRFAELGRRMARDNGYRVGQISRILYVAPGSSADYWYWTKGTLAYGIELATTKVPPTRSIPSVIDEAREMTWTFLEAFE